MIATTTRRAPLSAKKRWQHKHRETVGERGPTRSEEEEENGRRSVLVCAKCDAIITAREHAVEKFGCHVHSQVNPHGFVWEFGCFDAAPGCVPSGTQSTEFVWFSGYSWQVQRCAGCAIHVGWSFQSGDDAFFGLILSQLVERQVDRNDG